MIKVVLSDVRHGTGDRSKYIYAILKYYETGEILVSATLDYVLDAILNRGYVLVPAVKGDLPAFKPKK